MALNNNHPSNKPQNVYKDMSNTEVNGNLVPGLREAQKVAAYNQLMESQCLLFWMTLSKT
jgi:hypothetical protein